MVSSSRMIYYQDKVVDMWSTSFNRKMLKAYLGCEELSDEELFEVIQAASHIIKERWRF